MSASSHLVARVIWDSGFDTAGEVRAQQDWLSEFSHQALPDLLADVFDRCCPAGLTWRCDRLEVDLGTVLLSRAPHDLPDRLHRELTSALWRRFGAFTGPSGPGAAGAAEVGGVAGDGSADPDAAAADPLALLAHLLLHGTLPWWQKKAVAFLSLWGTALADHAPDLLVLLHRITPQEAVRQRLVWQLGRTHLPALIMLAEPTHAEALVEWVGALVARHVEDRLVQDDASGFEGAVWLALLTCLFTQRGSLFNLTDFASAHLRLLARSYGVAYEALLDRLDQISQRAAPHLPPRFLALIRAVLDRDAPPKPAPDSNGQSAIEWQWQLWAQMLGRGQPSATVTTPEGEKRDLRLRGLFAQLAAADGRRLARSMLAVGAPAGHVLAQHLDDKSLQRTVRLLQPGEADFILAHVAHSQHLAQRQHWRRRAVWDVVLTFLLSEHATRFERRQLVEQTLRENCRRHSTDLGTALSLLIAYAAEAGSDPRHYVLLQILLDMQADLMPVRRDRHPAPVQDASSVAADLWRLDAVPADNQVVGDQHFPRPLIWKALRWRLRMGRAAPDLPRLLREMSLAELWQRLPPADLRRWLLAQPDRAHLLPQLATVPAARRWLSRLVPPALRPLTGLLDQAVAWFGGAAVQRDLLEPVLWQLALDPRAATLTPALFLAQCLLLWCQRLGLGVAECAARGLTDPPSPRWRDAFAVVRDWADGQGPDLLAPLGAGRRVRPDAWGQWLGSQAGQAHLLRLLCRHSDLPLHRRHGVAALPAAATADQRLAAALYQWAWTRPDDLRRLLAKPWRRASVRPQLEARLQAALPLAHLLDLMGRESAARQAVGLIKSWQAWQRRLSLPQAGRRATWLWRMVWQAWLDRDWRALEPARLLAAFRQFFLPLSGGGAGRLDEQLLSARPPEIVAPLLSAPLSAPLPQRPAMPIVPDAQAPREQGQRPAIDNAGLVLLQSFLPSLFDRLGLVCDQRFLSPAATQRALMALQYLACGFVRAEEPQLALNKILCGLDLSTPVPVDAAFTDAETGLMDDLLRAVINHWPQSGASSLDGFRGNWLLRGGVLADHPDHWGLTVARRPWDILLSKSPFSFAVIKLPWMTRALYVTWPY